MENTKIAIIGLGYVGLPLAVEFAKLYQVVGFDINNQRVQELRNNLDVTLRLRLRNWNRLIWIPWMH